MRRGRRRQEGMLAVEGGHEQGGMAAAGCLQARCGADAAG